MNISQGLSEDTADYPLHIYIYYSYDCYSYAFS